MTVARWFPKTVGEGENNAAVVPVTVNLCIAFVEICASTETHGGKGVSYVNAHRTFLFKIFLLPPSENMPIGCASILLLARFSEL